MAEKKSFILRMSPELWDALQRLAADDFRSVNGEIEFILTEYARKRGATKALDAAKGAPNNGEELKS